MPGYLQVSLSAPPDQLTPYYRKLVSTLESLLGGELDSARFEESKRLVYQEFLLGFDDPVMRILKVLETDLLDLGINFITTFDLRLERVTPEAFQRRLASLIPVNQFVLVMAGSVIELEPFFKEIGRVEVLN